MEPSHLSNSFPCNPTLQKEEGEIPSLRDGSSGLRTLLSNGTKTSEQRRTWRENSWVGRQSQFENSISSREKQEKHKQIPRGVSPFYSSSHSLKSQTTPVTKFCSSLAHGRGALHCPGLDQAGFDSTLPSPLPSPAPTVLRCAGTSAAVGD